MSYNYKSGLFNASAYLVSGTPFISGGITVPPYNLGPTNGCMEIIFPSVTRKIIVHNSDGANDVRVGFSRNGVTDSKYFRIDSNQGNNTSNPQVFEVRTDRIFLAGAVSGSNTTNVSVYAELTGIVLDYNLCATFSGSAVG